MLTRNERRTNFGLEDVCPTRPICHPPSPALLHAKELYLPLQFTTRRAAPSQPVSGSAASAQWRISYKHVSGLEKVRDKPLPIQSGSVGKCKTGPAYIYWQNKGRASGEGSPSLWLGFDITLWLKNPQIKHKLSCVSDEMHFWNHIAPRCSYSLTIAARNPRLR